MRTSAGGSGRHLFSPCLDVTLKAFFALLALGAIWGASFLFIKVIVDETSPLELVQGRLVFGALAVGAVMVASKTALPRQRSLWPKIALWAAFGVAVPFVLISWAEQHIQSGTASVLNSSMPLFTALFAAAFLVDEQLTPARAAGLLVGFMGVVVLTGGDLYDLGDSGALGELAVIAAAVCYGGSAVYGRTLLRRGEPLALSGSQLLMGVALMLPILLAVRGVPDYSLSVEAWLSLLALGVFGTGLGVVVYLWLVDNIGSVRSSLVTYVIPIVGLLLGWAVLGESIGLNTVLGCALIIAGVAAVVRGQAPARQRLTVAVEATTAGD